MTDQITEEDNEQEFTDDALFGDATEEGNSDLGEDGFSAADQKYGIKLTPEQFAAFDENYKNNDQILEWFKENGMEYDTRFSTRQLSATRYQLHKKYFQASSKYIKTSEEEVNGNRVSAVSNATKKVAKLVKDGVPEDDTKMLKAKAALSVAEAEIALPIPPSSSTQLLTNSQFNEYGKEYTPGVSIIDFAKKINIDELKQIFKPLGTMALREAVVCIYKMQQFKKTENTSRSSQTVKPVISDKMSELLGDILDI